MVIGDLGVPGGAALKHVDLEQEQDLGAATILQQGMEGNTAMDQTVRRDLATLKLVQTVNVYMIYLFI